MTSSFSGNENKTHSYQRNNIVIKFTPLQENKSITVEQKTSSEHFEKALRKKYSPFRLLSG